MRELATIRGAVSFGDDVRIEGPCVLGSEGSVLHVPDGARIRPFSTIEGGVMLGVGFQTGQCTVVRSGTTFGDDVCVGSNSVIEPGAVIGSHVRIQGCCSLGEVTIGEYAFIGNGVAITDTPHPVRCPHLPCPVGRVTIGEYARIGGGVTIAPGVTVGRNSFVAAGQLVTKDVPADMLYYRLPGATELRPITSLTCKAGLAPEVYGWPPYE